jgi:hypothetical protein
LALIDLATGRVTCGSILLQPTTDVEALLVLPNTQKAPSIPGRTHLALGLHHCEGRAWGIGAMFAYGHLELVLLQLLDKDEEDWTLQNEERRQQLHDKFLEHLCGRVSRRSGRMRYSFDWGSVESTLDQRGVQAHIVVSYRLAADGTA